MVICGPDYNELSYKIDLFDTWFDYLIVIHGQDTLIYPTIFIIDIGIQHI